MPTDTERLDFIESYTGREATLHRAEGGELKVMAWTVATAVENHEGLRATIDHMIEQKGRLHNG